jgi:hypothetical protein
MCRGDADTVLAEAAPQSGCRVGVSVRGLTLLAAGLGMSSERINFIYFSCLRDCPQLASSRQELPSSRRRLWGLSLLGTPPPCSLACATVYAGPHSCRFALFVEIVATVADEGPSMAVGNHVGPKVSAIHMANRDGASVAIQHLGLTGNLPFSDEVRRCSVAACPAGHPSEHGSPDSGASMPNGESCRGSPPHIG